MFYMSFLDETGVPVAVHPPSAHLFEAIFGLQATAISFDLSFDCEFYHELATCLIARVYLVHWIPLEREYVGKSYQVRYGLIKLILNKTLQHL